MPSTLGIIASHIRPPTFSIIPNKTTLNEGQTVTFAISTTNYNSPNIYVSNSGTTANADLNYIFSNGLTLVGGTATFTVSALNDTAIEGPETLIVNLRTGSTTGPIVATAPTVTINDTTPVPPELLSYGGGVGVRTADLTSSGSVATVSVTGGLIKDGRWHKFEIFANTNFSGNCVAADLFVNTSFIGAGTQGSCFPLGTNYATKYVRILPSDTVTLRATRSGPGAQNPIYSFETWPHGYVIASPATTA